VRPRLASALPTVFLLLWFLTASAEVAGSAAAHDLRAVSNGRIAFSTGFDGTDPSHRSQIFTVHADGSDLRQLTHVGRRHHAVAPAFSPNGKKIVYQSDVSGSFQIWVMNADGSGKTQLTRSRRLENTVPSWSPNGSKIVFSRCRPLPFGFQDCHIAVMRANGPGVTVLTRGHWVDGAPKFSPDGDRIVFDSDRGGLESAVWVMKLDGRRMHRLTPPRLEAFWPNWSPDQTHITFTTNCCRLVGAKLWVMRADGSRAHAITAVSEDHNAAFGSFAPNGSKIVLVSDVRYPGLCCNDLYVMNADGSRMHTVLRNRPSVLFSDWGPTRDRARR
jgi:TolB protein